MEITKRGKERRLRREERKGNYEERKGKKITKRGREKERGWRENGPTFYSEDGYTILAYEITSLCALIYLLPCIYLHHENTVQKKNSKHPY